MLTFQFLNKSCKPFLSKQSMIQEVGTQFYIEQDPDPHFFQGSDPDTDPDPVFFKGQIRFRSKIV
jgi:hypothetical protein